MWEIRRACGEDPRFPSRRMPSWIGPRFVLGQMFKHMPLDWLAGVEHLDPRRGDQLVRWRRAGEAWRDRGLVFRAAREGRPMELSKRLRLGVLAGGAWVRGDVDGAQMDALEAARAGGHGECVELLLDARGSGEDE